LKVKKPDGQQCQDDKLIVGYKDTAKLTPLKLQITGSKDFFKAVKSSFTLTLPIKVGLHYKTLEFTTSEFGEKAGKFSLSKSLEGESSSRVDLHMKEKQVISKLPDGVSSDTPKTWKEKATLWWEKIRTGIPDFRQNITSR